MADVTAAGFRCVAPDLLGFGRSDKPANRSVYAQHVDWMQQFLDSIDPPTATLFAPVDKAVPDVVVPRRPRVRRPEPRIHRTDSGRGRPTSPGVHS
ncbi:MAG: alpha/beta fold hydrolase [Acidimicrobiales bacterium]